MAPEEIIISNELIAEFMGLKPYNDDRYGILYTNPVDKRTPMTEEGLRYHSSWDWLMPVVHKFRHNLTETHYLTFDEECTKQHIEHKKSINLMLSLGGIEEVFKVLIDGIKWHNQQYKS